MLDEKRVFSQGLNELLTLASNVTDTSVAARIKYFESRYIQNTPKNSKSSTTLGCVTVEILTLFIYI